MKYLFATLSLWTILLGFSGCAVKEREYHHRPHHERVYVEPEVVEERVVVR